MGGCCCCCSSRSSESNRTPTYYYCPRTSEERQPLSADHGGPVGLSAGLLVDTNLDTSNPDTYTPPPAPLSYDVDFGHDPTPPSPGNGENCGIKSGAAAEPTAAGSTEQLSPGVTLENLEKDLKEIDCKTKSILELTPSKDSEDDLKKPIEPILMTIEEEDCPICLEEYTEENPKMLTKCEHHFHLCCILEWMERSDSCPVCDKEVVIDDIIND